MIKLPAPYDFMIIERVTHVQPCPIKRSINWPNGYYSGRTTIARKQFSFLVKFNVPFRDATAFCVFNNPNPWFFLSGLSNYNNNSSVLLQLFPIQIRHINVKKDYRQFLYILQQLTTGKKHWISHFFPRSCILSSMYFCSSKTACCLSSQIPITILLTSLYPIVLYYYIMLLCFTGRDICVFGHLTLPFAEIIP